MRIQEAPLKSDDITALDCWLLADPSKADILYIVVTKHLIHAYSDLCTRFAKRLALS